MEHTHTYIYIYLFNFLFKQYHKTPSQSNNTATYQSIWYHLIVHVVYYMNTFDIKPTRQPTNHLCQLVGLHGNSQEWNAQGPTAMQCWVLANPIQPIRSFLGGPNNEMPQRPNPMKCQVMEATWKSQEWNATEANCIAMPVHGKHHPSNWNLDGESQD